MVAVVLPIGHYVGQYFTTAEAEEPVNHEIRYNGQIFSLSVDEHAVWAMAHSDLQTVQSIKPSRTWIESTSREYGVAEPGDHLDDLLSTGLLTQIMPIGNQIRQFAEAHLAAPLALGLGNTPDNLGMLGIGMPDEPRVLVGYEVYRLWCFLDDYPSIWDACVSVAANTEVPDATRDPATLLNLFFEALPSLLSVSCLYLDRRS